MIIFFESGKLGNQLFQYCAMRKYQPAGQIIASGMRELRDNFSGVDIVGTSKPGRLLERFITLIGKRRIEFVSRKVRLITMVEEVRSPSGIRFSVTSGLFKGLVYFKAGYYQSEDMIDDDISEKICLKKANIDIADHHSGSTQKERSNRYFVHVRRGDYVRWPDHEYPAVLPLDWYRTQMSRIRNLNPDARFIVVSDDKPYVDEFFSDERDVLIACSDGLSDFSTMSSCLGGGIMSASSFSWWASYFIRRENPGALFIAPRYWAGNRKKKWFPECIRTSWITYDDAY